MDKYNQLKQLFIAVVSFKTSCRMNSEQILTYYNLNDLYNQLANESIKYTPCKKDRLLDKVKKYIDAEDEKRYQQSKAE